MRYLVIAATKLEVAPFIQYQKKQDQVDVLITGIGAAMTSYHLTKQLVQHAPDMLVQAGIAGSFDTSIALGTVGVVTSDFFGDLSVVENKARKDVFDLGLLHADQKPFKDKLLVNPHKKLWKGSGLPEFTSVTVNEITTSKKDRDYYCNERKATVESMEGAALHYVALMEKIPFLQVRSISNYVGERNKAKWQIKAAVENLNHFLMNFVDTL